jgi:hypothetical protein
MDDKTYSSQRKKQQSISQIYGEGARDIVQKVVSPDKIVLISGMPLPAAYPSIRISVSFIYQGVIDVPT